MVDEAPFNDELFYRVASLPLQMPPLRRRKEDIRFSSRTFTQGATNPLVDVNLSRVHGSTRFSVLNAYHWPGNLAEMFPGSSRRSPPRRDPRRDVGAAAAAPSRNSSTGRRLPNSSRARRGSTPTACSAPAAGTRPRPPRGSESNASEARVAQFPLRRVWAAATLAGVRAPSKCPNAPT